MSDTGRFTARAGSSYVSINVYRATNGHLMIAGLIKQPGGRNPKLVRSIGLWDAGTDTRTPEDVMRAFLAAAAPGAVPLGR